MYKIDPENSVPDLLIDYPQLLNLFQSMGVEYTCGGKSLKTACQERGLNPVIVLRRCEEYLRANVE